jgi:hypothetical protein
MIYEYKGAEVNALRNGGATWPAIDQQLWGDRAAKERDGKLRFHGMISYAQCKKYKKSIGQEDNVESEPDEIKTVRKNVEFALRDNPKLIPALLKIGLRKDSIEYRVPDFGRVDIACSERSTSAFTSVELKIDEAGAEEAAQVCKYLSFQERIKGDGAAGRVVIIAPSFGITFWCVARRFPEIEAYTYAENDAEIVLTHVTSQSER